MKSEDRRKRALCRQQQRGNRLLVVCFYTALKCSHENKVAQQGKTGTTRNSVKARRNLPSHIDSSRIVSQSVRECGGNVHFERSVACRRCSCFHQHRCSNASPPVPFFFDELFRKARLRSLAARVSRLNSVATKALPRRKVKREAISMAGIITERRTRLRRSKTLRLERRLAR